MRQKMVWFVLGLMIGSLFLVAAYPQGSSPKNDTPPFQKIENSILVYYIGNETPSYFLRTAKVTGFRKIKTPHVLIVEGSYVENSSQLKKFIKEEILSGIPVIVKDNPELLKDIFKGQFYPRIVGGQKPDRTPLRKERVYGYVTYPLPEGILITKVFISVDSSPRTIENAYNWAVENLQPHAGSLEIEPLSSGAYWEYQAQLDLTTGDDWKPYGRFNIRTIYYYLMNDNSASYGWFDIHLRQQSVPGKELGWSGWRTADMYTWIDADYYNSDGFLFDYSPTTTYGVRAVTVSIGAGAGESRAQASASQSWSYTIRDVVVHDQSDFSQELAKWWHDVAEDKAVGKDTYMIEPGATLRFPESGAKEWKEHYGIRYAKPPKWWGLSWDYTTEGWIEVHIAMG